MGCGIKGENAVKVVLAGDTHSRVRAVARALAQARDEGADRVIQLGDFGFGWDSDFVPAVASLVEQAGVPLWWIDGNHENFDRLDEVGAFNAPGPTEIADGVTYIPRGTVLDLDGARVLCIGGAYSVDKKWRTPHVSWWEQEELRERDIRQALDNAEGGVEVVLSHDAPNAAFVAVLGLAANGQYGLEHLEWKNDQQFPEARPNRMALQGVLDALDPAPRLWVHGHYHSPYEATVGETRFVGLDMEEQPRARMTLDLASRVVEHTENAEKKETQ